jgi:LytS/YehU family sensor histidine kinase
VIGVYLGLIIASLIVMAAHALIYYQDFRAGEVKQSELKAQLAQAKLQALKMQLHPHFLFNTLHSISSLVLEDPPKANGMIARLGDFLRLTLEHSEEQMVTVQQEIEFLRCYLEIEQVRFEDRLTVDFKIEATTLAAHVPHLILQPLVENAVRHAIAPHATPGFIQVEAKQRNGRLRLEVKDSGAGIKTNGNSVEKQGVGLSNVRARLKQIYGKDFSFEMVKVPEAGLTVVLEMPFRAEISEDLVAR